MWPAEMRARYDRVRYPSDLTDEEWALIGPLLPPARRGGRRRSVDLRKVVQALLYLLETGCQWRHLPKDIPPKSTVWGYFDLWTYDGMLGRIHETLYRALREAEGRQTSPTAAIIDSQTVKSAEEGGFSRADGLRRRQEDQRRQARSASRSGPMALGASPSSTRSA